MVAKRSEDPDDLLSVPEAAELLRVSPSSIWRWIGEDRLPSFKVGQKRVRIRRGDALKLVVPNESSQVFSADELQRYLRPFSAEPVDWKTALEEARIFREKLLAENGGKLFSDSTADINEAREERTAEL